MEIWLAIAALAVAVVWPWVLTNGLDRHFREDYGAHVADLKLTRAKVEMRQSYDRNAQRIEEIAQELAREQKRADKLEEALRETRYALVDLKASMRRLANRDRELADDLDLDPDLDVDLDLDDDLSFRS
jgi:septal ring factor EnvC (AmiA/AmiB activator)